MHLRLAIPTMLILSAPAAAAPARAPQPPEHPDDAWLRDCRSRAGDLRWDADRCAQMLRLWREGPPYPYSTLPEYNYPPAWPVMLLPAWPVDISHHAADCRCERTVTTTTTTTEYLDEPAPARRAPVPRRDKVQKIVPK